MKKLLALLLTCAMVLSLGLLAGCGQTAPGDANLSLIHISEPTRPLNSSRMPSSA